MTPVFAALLIAALMAFVAWLISSPFRRPAAAGEAAAGGGDERRALESARELNRRRSGCLGSLRVEKKVASSEARLSLNQRL